GNYRASFPSHVSNQGWGPWEVNLAKILEAVAAPNEWRNVFAGNGTISGRYGPNQAPVTGLLSLPGSLSLRGPFPIDFAGYDESNPAAPTFTTPFLLPNEGTVPGTQAFPRYPATGYGNGNANERGNHPALYNVFNPGYRLGSDDRAFGLSNVNDLSALL